jgi:hypothetical protein
MGKGVIESAINDFGRVLRRRDASVRRRGSCGAAFQRHAFHHTVNALVAILKRRPILLVFFQERPSPHGSIENGARRSSNRDRTCHGGHEG